MAEKLVISISMMEMAEGGSKSSEEFKVLPRKIGLDQALHSKMTIEKLSLPDLDLDQEREEKLMRSQFLEERINQKSMDLGLRASERLGSGGANQSCRNSRLKLFRGFLSNENHRVDMNLHVTKQTITEALLELALLTVNAAQMRNIAEGGYDHHPFYVTCMFCVCTSLIFQVVIGVMLIINGRYNINRWADEKKAESYSNVIFVLIFIVTVVNVFLSTFRI